jgi:putative MATE family efflux protein
MFLKTSVTYREIWQISLPIIAGSAIENIINIIDTAFLGRVNEIALGAAAIGGIFYLAFIMLGWGFGIGAQIIISRRYGESNFKQIGKTFQHTAYFMFPLSIIILISVVTGEKIFFHRFLKSQVVNSAVNQFISIRIWGILFAYANILFRSFFIGILRTRILGYGSALIAVVTIILDYTLIFGHFGFKPMGIVGAAIASVSAEIVGGIYFFMYLLKKVDLARYGLSVLHKFDGTHLKGVMRTAAPVMFQFFISFTGWFIFFLLIEHVGQVSLAASNIVRSLYMIILLPLWGYASVCSTFASYKIGRKETEEVIPIVLKIITLGLLSIFPLVCLCNVFSYNILRFYTDNIPLINAGKPILHVISISSVLLVISFVLFNCVAGVGKTGITLIFETIVISAYVSWTYILVSSGVQNISLIWCAEILYGLLMGSMSGLYLRFGKWKYVKV